MVDQVGDDFGVGFRREDVALRLQLGAQRLVVLDDAVVHHRQPAPEKCGWALRSHGAPWVAQRVWAMPVLASAARRGLGGQFGDTRPTARRRLELGEPLAVQHREGRPSHSRGIQACAGPRAGREQCCWWHGRYDATHVGR